MIFLTGDAGFIGESLASALVRSGRPVTGLDLRPKASSAADYRQLIGSILDPAAVRHGMQGCSMVINLAAEHKDAGISRDQYFRVNVEGTKTLIAAMTELGIGKLIFFSSVAVYGEQAAPSEDAVPRPANPYGESKLLAEQAVAAWAAADPSRSAVIIRPTVVFGPWSKANIFKLIRYVCDGKFIWVGRGENVKSIAYIRNLVAATIFLMERATPGVEIFNYADEPHLPTRDLVKLIAAAAGVPEPRLHIPVGPAFAAAKVLDAAAALTGRDLPVTSARLRKFNATTMIPAEKIRSAGFLPPYTIDEGIRENVRWYIDEYRPRTTRTFESYDH